MSNWQGTERSHITRSQEIWFLILILKLACVSQQFISLPVQYEDWTVLQMNQQMVSVCKPLPFFANFCMLLWEYYGSLNFFIILPLPFFHLLVISQQMDFDFMAPCCLLVIPQMPKLASTMPSSTGLQQSFLILLSTILLHICYRLDKHYYLLFCVHVLQ